MVKLLFVQLFNSIGGAEILISNLIKTLPKNKYECHCVFLYREGLGKDEVKNNPCPVYYLNNYPDEVKGANIAFLADILGIDIVITTLIRNPIRYNIKKYYKGRFLEIVHSPIGVHRAYNHKSIKSMPDIERFDTIVSVSQETNNKALEYLRPFNPRALYYIPNGIDTNKYTPRYTVKKNFTVGNVARISREKNINRFFEIARLLPEFDFIWVGGILPMWEEYAKSYMQQKPSNVTITGYIHDKIEEYFNKLDIFMLTSDNEGMPLSVLEAMSSGLPVISTKVGNLHELLYRNFFYEKPQEAAMLIKEFYQNKDKRNKAGSKNRQIICDKYSIMEMSKKYDMLFSEMAGDK